MTRKISNIFTNGGIIGMKRLKHAICMTLTCLVLGMLISGVSRIESHAETKDKTSDIITLTGITRDKKGDFIAKKKYVTREEFAQMLVQASSYVGEVEKTNQVKLYKDVSKKSNKAAYIQISASKGYMRGYLGGMFKPSKAITLKEAIYGTLGLLGYTNEDFTGNFSNARYEKYKELGLSKNITCSETDKLTAKDCENLFYNLLNSKQKSGEIYCKTLGYSLNDDEEIDYQALLDKKTKGPYLVNKGWEKELSAKLSSYNIFLNNEKITGADINDYSIVYFTDNVKKIMVYNEKEYGNLDNITFNESEPQELMVSGTTYTVENPKKMKEILKNTSIREGVFVVLLFGRDGKVAYILPINSAIAESNWQNKLSFDIKEGTIYKNDKRTISSAIENYDVIYYSKELKTVWAFDKKVFGSLDSIVLNQGEPKELTVTGTNYTVENPKEMKKVFKTASIRNGKPVVLLFGWDNKVSNALPLSCVVAENNWQDQLAFDLNQGIIFKNGIKSTSDNIESNDVIYYSKELNTIWVYGKKAYGVLESISPNVSAPEQIIVAGKTYDLGSLSIDAINNGDTNSENLVENEWGNSIRKNGIKEGDNVVLLFGYNGKIADIYPVEKMPISIVGYVLSVDNKVVKNENQESLVKQVIRICDTEGVIREFPCTDNTIIKGTVVEVTFQYGVAIITRKDISASTNLSDIAGKKITEEARIIEVREQSYSKVSVAELNESKWSERSVIYCKLNSNGEITDLILRSTTDSLYQYGLLKKIVFPNEEEGSTSIQITVDINGTETIYEMDNSSWSMKLGPKAVRIEENKMKEIQELKEVRIAYISGKQANAGDAVYRIEDDVQVYFRKNGEYYRGTVDDITKLNNYYMYGYMKQNQGSIGVIVVDN